MFRTDEDYNIGDNTDKGVIEDKTDTQYLIGGQWYAKSIVSPYIDNIVFEKKETPDAEKNFEKWKGDNEYVRFRVEENREDNIKKLNELINREIEGKTFSLDIDNVPSVDFTLDKNGYATFSEQDSEELEYSYQEDSTIEDVDSAIEVRVTTDVISGVNCANFLATKNGKEIDNVEIYIDNVLSGKTNSSIDSSN